MSKNIGLYIRVSSQKQKLKGFSADEQLHRLNVHVDKKYPDYKKKIYIDKGYTGRNTNRPDYLRMINDMKLKKLDIVVIINSNRLHRSYVDFVTHTLKIARENSVKLESFDMEMDFDTPTKKAQAGFKIIIDELDSDRSSPGKI